MKLVYKQSLLKDLKPIRDKALLNRLQATIAFRQQLNRLKRPLPWMKSTKSKKLEGSEFYYRIRIGNYRLELRVEGDTITLVRFLHRKDIYRYFP